MGNAQLVYSAVEPQKIAARIAQLLADLKSTGKTYARSANGNMIVLSSDLSQNDSVDALIDSLAAVHPCRFFVIVTDEKAANFKCELAWRSITVSGNESTCSEVVRITAPSTKLEDVTGIVRAQLLSGMPIELYVFDGKVSDAVLITFSALADSAFYDAATFDARPEVLRQIGNISPQNVDVQWLALSRWRDEIRRVFDRAPARAVLPRLQRVEIETSGPDPETPPAAALLLAGWMCDRLGCVVKDDAGIERAVYCADGRLLELDISRRNAAGEVSLLAVRLICGDLGIVALTSDSNSIVIDVGIDPRYRVTVACERESRDALLQRYFLIGESITNYTAALRNGLALR